MLSSNIICYPVSQVFTWRHTVFIASSFDSFDNVIRKANSNKTGTVTMVTHNLSTSLKIKAWCVHLEKLLTVDEFANCIAEMRQPFAIMAAIRKSGAHMFMRFPVRAGLRLAFICLVTDNDIHNKNSLKIIFACKRRSRIKNLQPCLPGEGAEGSHNRERVKVVAKRSPKVSLDTQANRLCDNSVRLQVLRRKKHEKRRKASLQYMQNRTRKMFTL